MKKERMQELLVPVIAELEDSMWTQGWQSPVDKLLREALVTTIMGMSLKEGQCRKEVKNANLS